MAWIPDAKALVKRLEGKPFALFGISNDPEERYRAGVERHGIPWSSLRSDASDPPLASQWGIEMYPTLLVLDHNGVIRYRGHRGGEVERLVDELLADM